MAKKVKVTRVYDWLRNTKSRINILVGSAGSSKTYSIAQWLIEQLYSQENTEILVARKTKPALRKTIYKQVIDLLDEYSEGQKRPAYDLNRTELIVSYGKNRIIFDSIDDPQKIMSSQYNYIVLNEIIDFTYDDFKKIMLRLRRKITGDHVNMLIGDTNPVNINSWVKTKLIDGHEYEDVSVLHSTYRDNPYLNPRYIEELESYTGAFRQIYTLGEWVAKTELVYPEFKIISKINWNEINEITYGADPGFNHKAALVACYWRPDGRVIWHELIYQSGLTQAQFAEKIKEEIGPENRNKNIYVDSASPGLIRELYDMNLNAWPAKKAVLDGINTVKKRLIGVTESSPNLIREMRGYSWKKDKEGVILDEPVKEADDLVDGGRYATHSHTPQTAPQGYVGNLRTGEWFW